MCARTIRTPSYFRAEGLLDDSSDSTDEKDESAIVDSNRSRLEPPSPLTA